MGETIGIIFEDMNNAKTKLNLANADNKNINVKLFAAILTLQVECLTSHLMQSQEAIRDQVVKVSKRMDDTDKVITHVDYAVQRFQEVDANYATTIKGKVDEYRLQNQAMKSNENYGGVAQVGEFKNFNAVDLLAAGDINALDPSHNYSDTGSNKSYITQGNGVTVEEGKVEDPNYKEALIEAAKSPDSSVGYVIGAAEYVNKKELITAADDLYHGVISNSSSKREMYRKMFAVANDSADFTNEAAMVGREGARSLGTKLGVVGAVFGGVMTMNDDLQNTNYDTVDKTKAVTVDVGQMAATIGSVVLISAAVAALPAEVPALAVIAVGVGIGSGINWLAQTAKKEWID